MLKEYNNNERQNKLQQEKGKEEDHVKDGGTRMKRI